MPFLDAFEKRSYRFDNPIPIVIVWQFEALGKKMPGYEFWPYPSAFWGYPSGFENAGLAPFFCSVYMNYMKSNAIDTNYFTTFLQTADVTNSY